MVRLASRSCTSPEVCRIGRDVSSGSALPLPLLGSSPLPVSLSPLEAAGANSATSSGSEPAPTLVVLRRSGAPCHTPSRSSSDPTELSTSEKEPPRLPRALLKVASRTSTLSTGLFDASCPSISAFCSHSSPSSQSLSSTGALLPTADCERFPKRVPDCARSIRLVEVDCDCSTTFVDDCDCSITFAAGCDWSIRPLDSLTSA
mmetsp:Transcript_21748/g.69448  ORF Transcript_21748/g.69448 Transcript_21748/m.69448 type:complete len:203 (+) Transcript_21748:2004-2612(+)